MSREEALAAFKESMEPLEVITNYEQAAMEYGKTTPDSPINHKDIMKAQEKPQLVYKEDVIPNTQNVGPYQQISPQKRAQMATATKNKPKAPIHVKMKSDVASTTDRKWDILILSVTELMEPKIWKVAVKK